MARFSASAAGTTLEEQNGLDAGAMRLAFVDLETTGATAAADRITEIGIVQVDGDAVREWSSLVNPQATIPEFIQRLTGISDAMVATAPTFADLAGQVLAQLEGRLFIAHNARFDYGFLQNEFRRVGIDFRAPVLCTVKLSRKLFPQHHKHNLDSLAARHGLVASGRHRALADAQLIHQFWQRIHQELAGEELRQALAALASRPSLPAQVDPAIIDALPETPGVYVFYGDDGQPLYVGKGSNLRQRVWAHFTADHPSAKELRLSQELRRVEGTATGGAIGALLLEAALVKRLEPIHNRRLGKSDDLCSWQLRQVEPGLWRPSLVFARDVDFAETADLYGLFKHGREANRALAGIAEDHGLCPGLLGLEKLTAGRPCFAQQVGKCRGACIGKEGWSTHSGRLMAALARLRLQPWPHPGPAVLREGDAIHVIDGWRYRGTTRTDEQLAELLAGARPAFDPDSYKILYKAAARLVPIVAGPR